MTPRGSRISADAMIGDGQRHRTRWIKNSADNGDHCARCRSGDQSATPNAGKAGDPAAGSPGGDPNVQPKCEPLCDEPESPCEGQITYCRSGG